jgi:tetratricopeptide (TPR) repeat protein
MKRFLIAGILVLSMAFAAAADLKLTVRVRELGTSKPVDAKVTLEVHGESREFTRKAPGECSFNESMGFPNPDAYRLHLSPESPYIPRTVRVRCDRFKDQVTKSHFFSLAKEKEEFTYRYLDEGRKYFSRDFDGALAHFEIAYDRMKGDESKEYQVRLKYYYAKALHNTCLSLEYDTGAEGIKLYDELMDHYGSERSIYRKLGLTGDLLMKDRRDLEDKERISKYRGIPVLFKLMRYAEAAGLAEEALEAFKQDPKGFSRIGLTQDRLLTDAGVSYLKAAEDAEKGGAPAEEARMLLENAKGHLEKVEGLNPAMARENLKIIERKLMNFSLD